VDRLDALGIAGAAVGGYVAQLIGLYREGQPAGLVVSVLGAIALVSVYKAFTSGRPQRSE